MLKVNKATQILTINSKKGLKRLIGHTKVEVKAPIELPKIEASASTIPLQKDSFEINCSLFEKNFKTFEQTCDGITNKTSINSLAEAKMQFLNLRTSARYNNNINEFCEKVSEIALKLTESPDQKKQRFGIILLGDLIKTYKSLDNNEKVIVLAEKSLELSTKQGDKIHGLSRLYDLKNAYLNMGNKEKNYKLTKEALKYLDYIIKNYDEVSTKFQSLLRPVAPLKNFELHKAELKSKLAIIIAHKKRNKSIEYLLETKEIYSKYKNNTAVRFIEVQLKRLKASRLPNKLRKYDADSMGEYLHGKVIREIKTRSYGKNKVKARYSRFEDKNLPYISQNV